MLKELKVGVPHLNDKKLLPVDWPLTPASGSPFSLSGSHLHLSHLLMYTPPQLFVLGPLYVDWSEELGWLQWIKFSTLASCMVRARPRGLVHLLCRHGGSFCVWEHVRPQQAIAGGVRYSNKSEPQKWLGTTPCFKKKSNISLTGSRVVLWAWAQCPSSNEIKQGTVHREGWYFFSSPFFNAAWFQQALLNTFSFDTFLKGAIENGLIFMWEDSAFFCESLRSSQRIKSQCSLHSISLLVWRSIQTGPKPLYCLLTVYWWDAQSEQGQSFPIA